MARKSSSKSSKVVAPIVVNEEDASILFHDHYLTGEGEPPVLTEEQAARIDAIRLPENDTQEPFARKPNVEEVQDLVTRLEYALLDQCAFSLYTPENGAEPQSPQSVNVWFWPDELAKELGITEQGVGGVVSSLIKKGLVGVSENTEPAGSPSDAAIWFTDEGYAVWQELYDLVGRPENRKLETLEGQWGYWTDSDDGRIWTSVGPVEEAEPVAAPAASSSGFQYLTREALAELAVADPAARQAYRMARRKAARAARKAKKSA